MVDKKYEFESNNIDSLSLLMKEISLALNKESYDVVLTDAVCEYPMGIYFDIAKHLKKKYASIRDNPAEISKVIDNDLMLEDIKNIFPSRSYRYTYAANGYIQTSYEHFAKDCRSHFAHILLNDDFPNESNPKNYSLMVEYFLALGDLKIKFALDKTVDENE